MIRQRTISVTLHVALEAIRAEMQQVVSIRRYSEPRNRLQDHKGLLSQNHKLAIACDAHAQDAILMLMPTAYRSLYLLQNPPCLSTTVAVVHQQDESMTAWILCTCTLYMTISTHYWLSRLMLVVCPKKMQIFWHKNFLHSLAHSRLPYLPARKQGDRATHFQTILRFCTLILVGVVVQNFMFFCFSKMKVRYQFLPVLNMLTMWAEEQRFSSIDESTEAIANTANTAVTYTWVCLCPATL